MPHISFSSGGVGVEGRGVLYLFSLTPFRLEAGGVLRLSGRLGLEQRLSEVLVGCRAVEGEATENVPAQGHVSKHCWLGVCVCVECPLLAQMRQESCEQLSQGPTPSGAGS